MIGEKIVQVVTSTTVPRNTRELFNKSMNSMGIACHIMTSLTSHRLTARFTR